MIYQHKYISSLILLCLFSLGLALQIKSQIGQSVTNAFALSLSQLLPLSIGTIISCINLCFWSIGCLLTRFRNPCRSFLQILVILMNGWLVDAYLTFILRFGTPVFYGYRLLLFLGGLTLAALALGLLAGLGVFTFPLEGCCIALSEILAVSLSVIRMGIDTLFLGSTLVLTLIFNLNWTLREGTLISYVFLSIMFTKSYQWILSKKK